MDGSIIVLLCFINAVIRGVSACQVEKGGTAGDLWCHFGDAGIDASLHASNLKLTKQQLHMIWEAEVQQQPHYSLKVTSGPNTHCQVLINYNSTFSSPPDYPSYWPSTAPATTWVQTKLPACIPTLAAGHTWLLRNWLEMPPDLPAPLLNFHLATFKTV